MKKILYILLLLFLASAVYAVEPVFTRPVNVETDIPIKCDLDGASCPLATECNISVRYPNKTLMLNRTPISRDGDQFYYTHRFNVVGDYDHDVKCCYDTTCDSSSFFITIIGNFFTNFNSLTGVFLVFIMLLLWLFLYIIGYVFQNIAFIGFALFVGIILAIMFGGFNIMVSIIFFLFNIIIYIQSNKSI